MAADLASQAVQAVPALRRGLTHLEPDRAPAPIPTPTVIILPPPDLGDIASRINAEVDACEVACRASVDHAIQAGRLLVDAKLKLGHGRFGPWIAANVKASDRMVRLYMAVANGWENLKPEERKRVADLPLRQALRVIQAPKPNRVHKAAALITAAPDPLVDEPLLARIRADLAEALVRGLLTPARIAAMAPGRISITVAPAPVEPTSTVAEKE